MPLDFASFPLWVNLAVFAAAAALTWFAGTRLSETAEIIAERSDLGRAFIGVLLLATVTSLPEIASISTASLAGNARLAANNLLGGVALQIMVLAVVDALIVRGSLTFFTPRFVLLLQGVLLVLLLTLAVAGSVAGITVSVFNIGLWSMLLFGVYLLILQQVYQYRKSARWTPLETEEERKALTDREDEELRQRELRGKRYEQRSNARVALTTVSFGLVILAGGWAIAQVGGAFAEQTGLGQSFVGATFVSLATSMPELSTTISAARMGSYTMAIGNIFGSNCFMVALFLVADVFYREGVVMEAVERPTQFTALLAIVLVCVFLWGLLERRDKTIGRIGFDSGIVISTYVGGLYIIYTLS